MTSCFPPGGDPPGDPPDHGGAARPPVPPWPPWPWGPMKPGPGGTVRAAVQGLGPALLSGTGKLRGERVTQGEVEVDRSGQAARAARRLCPRLTGQRAPVRGCSGPWFWHAGLAEPAHRAAEQLDLVDGLVSAGAPELGRPVGGERQQRHAGLIGLDDRGMEVGRRRARGAQHRCRAPARLGQAEGGKRRGALVDPDVQPHPALPLQVEERHGQRRAPRSRGDHDLAQPAAGQLVAERDAERGGRVHR
jgi:hypothetical protein